MLTLAAHFRDVGLIGRGERRSMDTGSKVVYIAPMKALAQEVVDKVSKWICYVSVFQGSFDI
jgi:activating signal cointegrator complex subunit 3